MKTCAVLIVLWYFSTSATSISNKIDDNAVNKAEDNVAFLLWNLTGLALQNAQVESTYLNNSIAETAPRQNFGAFASNPGTVAFPAYDSNQRPYAIPKPKKESYSQNSYLGNRYGPNNKRPHDQNFYGYDEQNALAQNPSVQNVKRPYAPNFERPYPQNPEKPYVQNPGRPYASNYPLNSADLYPFAPNVYQPNPYPPSLPTPYPPSSGYPYPQNVAANYPSNPGGPYPPNVEASYPPNIGAIYSPNPGAPYSPNPVLPYPANFGTHYPPNIPQQYPPNTGASYPPNFGSNPPYPFQHYPGIRPPYPLGLTGIIPGITNSVTEALNLIARNDELQCVPRLLCEFASGPDSLSQYKQLGDQGGLFSGIKIDTSSLLQILGGLNMFSGSPVLVFARAALLGYSNRKNTNECHRAYSRCPRNPDELVNYLNNYNGGFFRYFGGVQNKGPYNPYQPYQGGSYPQHPQQFGQYQQYNQQSGYQQYKKSATNINQNAVAQKRIQNRQPSNNLDQGFNKQTNNREKKTNFFGSNSNDNNVFDKNALSRRPKVWKFPDTSNTLIFFGKDAPERQNYRKGHSLKYGLQSVPHDSTQSGSNYQRYKDLLLNQQNVAVHYPDRTGTGELVLDL